MRRGPVPDTQPNERGQVTVGHRGHELDVGHELVAVTANNMFQPSRTSFRSRIIRGGMLPTDGVDVDQILHHHTQLLQVLGLLRILDRPDQVVYIKSQL